ncbi:NlpC/P60 family protein [Streptomyces sp. 6N223]|uniref:NlpC/P60 family protein n=1 Tax=Streptomyces sp. 6N223 TaxID=3457412 RepID=UPI003FD51C5C
MVCHRRPRPAHALTGRTLTARVAVLSVSAATATTAAVALTAVPVLAEPSDPPPPDTSAEAAADVDRLFAKAERAVEAFNATAERVEDLRAEAERRQHRVAQGQQAVNEQRRTLGTAAAAQYRAGGVDPSLALMLSTDPDGYLDRAATLDRVGDRQSGTLRELLAAQRTLERRRTEAQGVLAELTEEHDRLARDKRTAQRRLAAAQRRYNRLTAEEREARERRERRARLAAAQPLSTAADAGGAGAVPSSARAATAVAAARGAVGAPYAWGQAGPDAFDCSGLVQWAYAQAGVALPRTSQGQAAAGRPVPHGRARPGDIVVYRADASHVAIYVGGGQIVHAPYPGAEVRYDPVGVMPVASVVRP